MSFADWQSGVITDEDTTNQCNFVCISTTVDDLSYTPSEEERSRDAAQIAATGRRSWKTLRGKGEAVWPPNLEAALIEALEKYQPDSARPAKTLGRFPMRNRFISDYIFEITGKRRTPKQVGSRLQQLRDTCKGGKILQLISRRRSVEVESGTASSGTPSEYSRATSVTPTSDLYEYSNIEDERTVVYINIHLESRGSSSCSRQSPVIPFVNNDANNPIPISLSPVRVKHENPCYRYADPGLSQSVLGNLNSTVEFVSPCRLTEETAFSTFRHDLSRPVHTESAPLKCRSSPIDSSGWRYSCNLIPGFWDSLCNSKDPTEFTIEQSLYPVRNSPPADINSPLRPQKANHRFSIVYCFTVPDAPKLQTLDCCVSQSISSNVQNQFCTQNELLPMAAQTQWESQHHFAEWPDYPSLYPSQPYSDDHRFTSHPLDRDLLEVGAFSSSQYSHVNYSQQPRQLKCPSFGTTCSQNKGNFGLLTTPHWTTHSPVPTQPLYPHNYGTCFT